MNNPQRKISAHSTKRMRVHELLIALIQKQHDLELMDDEIPINFDNRVSDFEEADPARWLERNKRIMKNYQSLVRTAITLDSLMDLELSQSEINA